MKHATTVALYEHWQSLRGRRRAPPRSAIQPASLGPLLPDLFLIETDLTRGAPFRFCGASIARLYGRDLEGESFLGWWADEDRKTMRRNLAVLQCDQVPLVLGTIAETAGGGATTFEMTLLPLFGSDSCDGAIGAFVRTGGHDDTNRIRARVVSQEIRSQRFLADEDASARPQPRFTADVAPPPRRRPERPSPSLLRSRPRHLTLVVGGNSSGQLP